uniref:Sad1 and UNC84 domain containing 2 [Falco peregrinus] n=1 Tax=Lepeophtheirus salmonis TaxID=72036 RepID=A0A0K2TYC1_LEPSM
MMTSTYQPRRSQRLSQSSLVRFPSEARSPTPGKIQRKLTPARANEEMLIPSRNSSLRTLSSDEEDDDGDDGLSIHTPQRHTKYPKVFLLKEHESSSSNFPSLSEQIHTTWKHCLTKAHSFSFFNKKTTIILLNILLILGLVLFGYSRIPWSALTSWALADFRFMAMVAPDFLMGMLMNPFHHEELDQTTSIPNIDLIVNKILNNEKFGNFVRELNKNSRSKGGYQLHEELEKIIQNMGSHDHSEEIRASVKHLKERVHSNKIYLDEQFNSIWKELDELKHVKEDMNRKKLTAFEERLKDLNEKLGTLKDYLLRSENGVQKCESQVKEMSTKTNHFIREYVSEIIHDNTSQLSVHLQDKFVSQMDMRFIIRDIETNMKTNYPSESTSGGSMDHFVEKALIKYDADKTGMFDFALETAGGTIMSTRCTETHDVSWAVHSIFGIPFWWERNNARTILQPSSNPGQCWAFKGSQGSVVIELSRPVNVEAVSLEHISKMMAPERKILSAPKRFAVLGLTSLDDESPIVFGNFTYNDNGNPVQTFHVPTSSPVKLVELKVLSNYGHLVYTCVYRFRVHGTFADSTPEK